MPGTAWKRSLHHPKAFEAVKEKMMERGMTEDDAQEMAAKVTNSKDFGKKKKDK